MRHKITGVHFDGRRGAMVVTGLAQSPRGTRVLLESVRVEKVPGDKDKFRRDLEQAIGKVLSPGD